MKKLLLLFTCIAGLLHSVPYSQLRSNLKTQLSQGHANFKMISNDDYMEFIEKYIIQAEQELTIIREISKITDISDYQASALSLYFQDLGTIHGYMFDDLIKPNRAVKEAIQSHLSWLRKSMQNLKKGFNLDIDTEIELQKTLELLHKANQDFIKHIGKIKITGMRMAKRWERFKERVLIGVLLYPACPWLW